MTCLEERFGRLGSPEQAWCSDDEMRKYPILQSIPNSMHQSIGARILKAIAENGERISTSSPLNIQKVELHNLPNTRGMPMNLSIFRYQNEIFYAFMEHGWNSTQNEDKYYIDNDKPVKIKKITTDIYSDSNGNYIYLSSHTNNKAGGVKGLIRGNIVEFQLTEGRVSYKLNGDFNESVEQRNTRIGKEREDLDRLQEELNKRRRTLEGK